MHRITCLVAFIALTFSLSACHKGGAGEQGNADFSYTSCLLGGCNLDDNFVAAGGAVTHIRVTLRTGIPAIASVSSSNPSVATFVRSGGDVQLTSGAAGEADLILLDGANVEIDRATVKVRNTDRLEVNSGWSPSPGPTILAGTVQVLHTTTRQGDQVLFGTGAVHFTPSGTLRSAVAVVFGDSYAFTGDPGTGAIAASCPNAQAMIPVTVVADVDTVEQSTAQLTFAGNSTANLEVTAKANNAPVYVDGCAWTSNPMGLLVSRKGGGSLSGTATSTYEFSGLSGSYDATCDIGTKKAQVHVTVN